MKAIIIGGGISGCTIAYLLRKKGYDITIIEKDDDVGGICRTYSLNGIQYEFGPHILYTNDQEIRAFFEQFIKNREKKFFVHASIDGTLNNLCDFPVSVDNVLKLDNPTKVINELYHLNLDGPNLTNFEQYVQSRMGETLYDTFIKGYNIKQWGISPKDMLPTWAKFRKLCLTYEDKGMFGNMWQGYPENGYGELFDQLAQGITVIQGVVEEISIDRSNAEYALVKLSTGELVKISGDIFISTIPIDCISNRFEELPYRGICKVFALVEEDYVMPTYLTTFPNNYSFTRIMEYKHETQQNVSGSILSAVFPFDAGEKNLPIEKWTNEFISVLTTITKCHVTETISVVRHYVYPISTANTERIFWNMMSKIVKCENLFVLGRLGLYAYVSMDTCVYQAMKLVKMMEEYETMGHRARLDEYKKIRARLS